MEGNTNLSGWNIVSTVMFEMPIKHDIKYLLIVYFICYYSGYMSP